MLVEYSFTDKTRNFRNYHTIVKDDCCYSEILFHKVKWSIANCPDITDLNRQNQENMPNISRYGDNLMSLTCN
jgi:hypothetical protein